MYYITYKGIVVYQLLGAGIAYLVGRLIINLYLSFFVGAIVFLLIALGGFILFGKSEEETQMFKKVMQKIKKKKDTQSEV